MPENYYVLRYNVNRHRTTHERYALLGLYLWSTQVAPAARRQGQPIEFRPMRVPAIKPGGIAAWAISVAVGIFLIQADGLDEGTVIAIVETD
jgi:hypothetical protein